MSNYGADEKPDLNKAHILAWDNGFLPQRRANVMQWTYGNNTVVRKLANKSDGSNCLFKIDES